MLSSEISLAQSFFLKKLLYIQIIFNNDKLCSCFIYTFANILSNLFESTENQNLQNLLLNLNLNQLGYRWSYEIKSDFISNYISFILYIGVASTRQNKLNLKSLRYESRNFIYSSWFIIRVGQYRECLIALVQNWE